MNMDTLAQVRAAEMEITGGCVPFDFHVSDMYELCDVRHTVRAGLITRVAAPVNLKIELGSFGLYRHDVPALGLAATMNARVDQMEVMAENLLEAGYRLREPHAEGLTLAARPSSETPGKVQSAAALCLIQVGIFPSLRSPDRGFPARLNPCFE